jgi:peptidoglycan hydrolase-like protein with peptidoglycan-binding domain
MPDETATTTQAQPAAGAAAHPTGAGANEPRPDPLPDLDADSTETDWIKYLQQMLNYHYQSQVVTENGQYDTQTAGAVEHFRSQQGLHPGPNANAKVWEKLGVEDPLEAWKRTHPQGAGGQTGHPPAGQQHGDGQHAQQEQAYEPVYHNASLVTLNHDGAGWAAAMAIVLNSKNGSSLTTENVCEQGHVEANDYKSASDTRSIGTELGLQQVTVNGSTPAGWAQALAYGALWTPNPQNDHNVLVIAGVSGTGAEAIIHVLDPATSLDDWMQFAQFTQQYGFGEHHELLA